MIESGGTSHGFVFYGSNHYIHNNVSIGNLPLFEVGGSNHIHNNTCVASGSTAYLTGLPTGNAQFDASLFPVASDVTNNIFVTSSAANYGMWDYDGQGGTTSLARGDNGDDFMTHYIDYNCYWNTADATKITKMGAAGVESDTIEELIAVWATGKTGDLPWNDLCFEINDQHSLMEDPLLDGNYVPQNPNVKTGGKPDINGNPTSMGAIVLATTGVSKSRIFGGM
jgi:hypothetical protein